MWACGVRITLKGTITHTSEWNSIRHKINGKSSRCTHLCQSLHCHNKEYRVSNLSLSLSSMRRREICLDRLPLVTAAHFTKMNNCVSTKSPSTRTISDSSDSGKTESYKTYSLSGRPTREGKCSKSWTRGDHYLAIIRSTKQIKKETSWVKSSLSWSSLCATQSKSQHRWSSRWFCNMEYSSHQSLWRKESSTSGTAYMQASTQLSIR